MSGLEAVAQPSSNGTKIHNMDYSRDASTVGRRAIGTS